MTSQSLNLDWRLQMGFARSEAGCQGNIGMKRIIAGLLIGFGLMGPVAAPNSALAQGVSGTVVELYTSQGCSSCPPADAYLAKLAREPGVIALALHVDYWDYIGWADTFGNPRFSDRQRDYARAAGGTTIYTPQMVVQGVDHAVGSDPDDVAGMIRRHQSGAAMVVLQLTRQGKEVRVHAKARVALEGPLVVQLVRYRPLAKVVIERGENAGRTINYVNIVTSWTKVGEWRGGGDLDMVVPAPGAEAVVVILQEPGPGMIFAASALR